MIACLLSCWPGDRYGWAGANICEYFFVGGVKPDGHKCFRGERRREIGRELTIFAAMVVGLMSRA